MTVHQLGRTNQDVIAKLDYESYFFALLRGRLEGLSTNLSVMATVATHQGNPIGFAIWERAKSNRDSKPIIHRLGVLPAFRRQGVGTKILGWVLDDLRREGGDTLVSTLSLNTCRGSSDPHDVSGFMTKMGFKCVAEVDEAFFEYFEDVPGYVFEKDIR